MCFKNNFIFFIAVFSLFGNTVFAQTTEAYVANKRYGVDIMWFKFIQNFEHENTRVLFFSRNRASSDYDNTFGAFGSVNAFSYNFKNGVGIVSVGTFLNAGFTPKAGVQYYKQKGDFMFFGWAVADIKRNGNIDVFGLFRFQPALNEKWKLFSQVELFPVYNPSNNFWFLTERARLGLKIDKLTIGFMADFNQFGSQKFTSQTNMGGFARYEF
jgi:hypothetical protein